MPARLSQGDGCLTLKLGGTKDEFAAQLARAKAVAGRRYNGEAKTWEFPDSDDSLLKVVYTVEPDLTADLERRVQNARQEQASSLLTALPDDAPVAVPWQERLAGKQRSAIDFGATHGHVLLADDMGAGKTVEGMSIVYEHGIRHLPDFDFFDHERPCLAISPNSVTRHWRKEIVKWTPLDDDCIQIIDGKNKKTREAQLEAEALWYIVNWEKLQARVGLVVGNSKGRGPLELKDWYGIIADEAHRAKNHEAQITRALWQLQAPVQIAASGTPVMNNPGELYALLRWLRPEQYTSYWKFFHSYTEFYEGYKGKPTVIGVKNADALRFELADKMIRRTKREIHPSIPEPFEPIVYEPPMGAEQQKVYDDTEKDFWLEIATEARENVDGHDPHKPRPEQVKDAIEAKLEGASFDTIKLMIPNAATRTLRLRQVSTSPAVIGGLDVSSKLDDIERVVRDGGDRPWAFFAWFQPSVQLLIQRFESMGLTVQGFSGDTHDAPERAEMSDAFQRGEFQIIVASIGAGGQGIEFFRAADCGFLEEDWVPGINQQAFDRIDRKGQQQRPQRHIWRTPNTVDTGSIAPKLATKKLITSTLLGDA